MHTSKHTHHFLRRVAPTVVALAALTGPATAAADPSHVDGVRAVVKHGTLDVNGGDRANTVALRLAAGDGSVVQVDVGDDGTADFSFARSGIDAIRVAMGDGDDFVRIDDANGAFTNAIPTTISGGDGNDILRGGLGAETFRSGDGSDFVAGGKGNDTAYLGDGSDVFLWDPGDASDVVEGQGGTDRMLFNGAAGAESFTMTANGPRLTFFRSPGNVTMDTAGVEIVDLNALGGADNVTVNDLSGTDVTRTNVDLAGTLGGNAGDGAIDTVTVNGTDGDDNIAVTGGATDVGITGLASEVGLKHADPADRLLVNTLAGTDNVAVSGVAGLIQAFVDGIAV
ncbi:MAG: calcium-binding protein [Thermoleophilaceae bacterium]